MHVVPRIMWQPEAFLDPQNAEQSLAAGASPKPHWGSLQCSPNPLARFKGSYI